MGLPADSSPEPKSVLAVRFSAMGDVIMTIPLLYALCRQYPDVRFIFLTRAGFSRFFIDAPSNLSVIGWDLKHEAKSVFSVMRLARGLFARQKFSGFVDLHDVIRSRAIGLMAAMFRIPSAKIDKGRREKKRLIRQGALKFGHSLKSTLQRYADTFARLGFSLPDGIASIQPLSLPADSRPGLPWPAAARSLPLIGIAPFAAHRGKIYPLERMHDVVRRLSSAGYRILLFGAPGTEQQTLDSWALDNPSHIISVPSLCLGLDGEVRLISTLDLMVAMDSGNMHMASLVGVPVVSIWGATHPFAGFASPTAVGSLRVQASLRCRPCSIFGNKPCRLKDSPYKCMSLLSPDMIIDKITSALREP